MKFKKSAIGRLILLLAFLLLSISTFCQSKLPELPKHGKELIRLVPKNWKVLATTNGDLNNDRINDLVFVIEDTNKKNLQVNDTGFGRDTINLNPRILSVYFGNKNGKFIKKLQSNSFILLQDSPTMDEPLDAIKILKNGILQINFKFWFSTGSWFMSNNSYKFKFQNSAFELISYESYERHRASGEETDYTVDFLNKTMKITKTTFDEETEKEISHEKVKKFELNKLKSIRTLKKPFTWKLIDIRI